MASDLEILQNFAQSLASYDAKTVKAYLSAMRGFAKWVIEQPGGNPFSPDKITETAINSYLNYMIAISRAPRTRNQTITALRRFCRWAIDEGYMINNPANQIQRPTIVNTAPRELTPDQRYVLKNRIDIVQSHRLSAIFALGYWTGLRISEVAHLQLNNCHLNQRTGHIIIKDSKGSKTRTIDLHNQTRRAVYDYLYREDRTQRDARDPDSSYLFTSQRAAWLRQYGRLDHLSVRGLGYIWTRMKQQSSQEEYALIRDITFHDLRHDFAHRARATGWGLEEIAVYLGHQTRDGLPAITTTARYTLPSRQQLKQRLQELTG